MKPSPLFFLRGLLMACLFRAAAFVIAAVCAFGMQPLWAIDTDFHYLAADPSLRVQTHNVNVTMCQATYVGKVLERDQTWESPYNLGYPGSVVMD